MDKKFIVLNEMAIENGRSLANEINGFVAILEEIGRILIWEKLNGNRIEI